MQSSFIIISTFPYFYSWRHNDYSPPVIGSFYFFSFICICELLKFFIKNLSTFNFIRLFWNTRWNLSVSITRGKILIWYISFYFFYLSLNSNWNPLCTAWFSKLIQPLFSSRCIWKKRIEKVNFIFQKIKFLASTQTKLSIEWI